MGGGDLIICAQKTVNFWQPSLTGANWIKKNLLHYASKTLRLSCQLCPRNGEGEMFYGWVKKKHNRTFGSIKNLFRWVSFHHCDIRCLLLVKLKEHYSFLHILKYWTSLTFLTVKSEINDDFRHIRLCLMAGSCWGVFLDFLHKFYILSLPLVVWRQFNRVNTSGNTHTYIIPISHMKLFFF